MSTPDADDETTLALLARWHGGERAALDALVEHNLPFLRLRLQERLGDALLARANFDDYLHDAIVEVLTYAPRFLVGSAAAFRRLLARILENMLRDRHDFWARLRRTKAKEEPLPDDSVLRLDAAAATATTPSRAAARNEEAALLRLALDLLDPEDRTILVLRQYEDLSFAEIGEQLGVRENAARMRFQRALGSLGEELDRLRRGLP